RAALVINNDPKRARVVLQVVVVDSKVEPARVADADLAFVVADEEQVLARTDPADQRRAGPAGHRPPRVAVRAAFARGAVLAARAPAHLAGRAEAHALTGPHVDAGVGPLRRRIHVDAALAHPRRPLSVVVVAPARGPPLRPARVLVQLDAPHLGARIALAAAAVVELDRVAAHGD